MITTCAILFCALAIYNRHTLEVYNSDLMGPLIITPLQLCCLLRMGDELYIVNPLLELLQPFDDALRPVRKQLHRVRLRMSADR